MGSVFVAFALAFATKPDQRIGTPHLELPPMKAAVVVFPGLNRDRDMIAALTKIGGQEPAVVWHKAVSYTHLDVYKIQERTVSGA